MATKRGPVLPDVSTLIQAGINPRTGLPLKIGDSFGEGFKPHNKELLRIIDRQDAINRYKWWNLPEGMDGRLIERVLYYKGQGMFFYIDTLDRYFFLPYALEGGIDIYGQFEAVRPLPFNGSTSVSGDDEKTSNPFTKGIKRYCQYDIIPIDAVQERDINEKCVLLHDYSIGISQNNIPRSTLQDPLLDVMADMIPFMRTALLNATGIQGMRVQGEDDQSNVEAASRSINHAALAGKKYIPIVGLMEFQELTGGDVAKSEEFFMAMQSLDNYRLAQYGIKNGGLFQKHAHVLQAEQDFNTEEDSYALKDGLENRLKFCDIVNSIWELGIDCEIAPPLNAMEGGDVALMDDDMGGAMGLEGGGIDDGSME